MYLLTCESLEPNLEETVTVDAVSPTADVVDQFLSVTGLENIDYTIAGIAYLQGEGSRKLPFEQKSVLHLTGTTQ